MRNDTSWSGGRRREKVDKQNAFGLTVDILTILHVTVREGFGAEVYETMGGYKMKWINNRKRGRKFQGKRH